MKPQPLQPEELKGRHEPPAEITVMRGDDDSVGTLITRGDVYVYVDVLADGKRVHAYIRDAEGSTEEVATIEEARREQPVRVTDAPPRRCGGCGKGDMWVEGWYCKREGTFVMKHPAVYVAAPKEGTDG